MSNYPPNLPILTPFPDGPATMDPVAWQTKVFQPIADVVTGLTGGSWTPIPLINGWARYSSTWLYPSYRVYGGFVICRGLIAGGAGVIWVPPAALMPSGRLRWAASADPNLAATVALDPASGLSVSNYGTGADNGYLSLDSISWVVE